MVSEELTVWSRVLMKKADSWGHNNVDSLFHNHNIWPLPQWYTYKGSRSNEEGMESRGCEGCHLKCCGNCCSWSLPTNPAVTGNWMLTMHSQVKRKFLFSFLQGQFVKVFNNLMECRRESEREALFPLLNNINVLFSKAPDLVSCSSGAGWYLKTEKIFYAWHHPSVKVCNHVSVKQGGAQREHVATLYLLWTSKCEKIALVAKHCGRDAALPSASSHLQLPALNCSHPLTRQYPWIIPEHYTVQTNPQPSTTASICI